MAIDPGLKTAYRDWTRAPERGSTRLLALIVRLGRLLPRNLVRPLLYPIVAYFVIFSPRQRAASRQFLARALSRPARWSEVFAHYLTFARMLLDRVYWLSRAHPRIPVRIVGAETVEAMLASRRHGLIVLGAHFGSFEALRGAGSRLCGRRIRPVMYVANARKVQSLLDALNPDIARDVILAGRPSAMLEIRAALEDGDIVGMLADRSPFAERSVQVSFMGEPAPFPLGAHRLAAVLDVPVVFACAVLDEPGYTIHFEPMEAPAAGAVADREHLIAAQAAAFARHLERRAREYPLNWFNFYDFWRGAAATSIRAGRSA